MFVGSLIVILAIAYILLKVSNMRARFAEADAKREAEEEAERLEAEEAAEDAMTRAEAVDVEAEVIETEE